MSSSGLITVNHIAIIAAASAQQTNSTIISNATTLAGRIEGFTPNYSYLIFGEWNMTLAKPLAQSQSSPIAKTFDSSFTEGFTTEGRPRPFIVVDNFTISDFKQISASTNGKTSATINGTATITQHTDKGETTQNVPISIKLM